ncbi:MAG: MogA/MoaB family molybdenum cofactor biosynthesis protein [Nitrospirota bacterium]
MGHKEHKEKAVKNVNCMVITVSDTRTEETDSSGKLIQSLLKENGHKIAHYKILKDVPVLIRDSVANAIVDNNLQAIIINGGTGISKRDTTFEAVDSLLEKRLEGFGELFRYLSFQEIGSAAIMSRASAGVYRGKIIISVPGSEPAVKLAMEKLILPELGHIVWEINR